MNQPTPPWSTGPPPVYDYDYPADPAPRSAWLTIVAIVGVCVAVIAVVIAATVIFVRKSEPTVISIASPAPSTVTSVTTMTTPVPVPVPVLAPRATVTAPAPPPVVVVAPPSIPASSCPQLLRNQANIDYQVTVTQATGHWVPQLSSKQPGLVADGITWDCDAIWAEHLRLRDAYGANLLLSGDWPHTYGHDDYWVTVAAFVFDTAEGARQWCQDHGRDVPEHCYPTQIR